MKKVVYLLAMISILSTSVLAQPTNVLNASSGFLFTDISYLRATLVNQDPSPADPGAYVNLLFQIENRGTDSANNATVELIPEYPFSLDPGVSAVTELGTVSSFQSGNNAFLVKYKVRVDENAINGDNEIKLKYSVGDGSVSNTVPFNISVSNPRTDFEVVAQDSTTLAIANIGSNTASSVIVSIPSQEGFRVSGASSSIIGNLNAGDYTLATFQITPTATPTANVSARNLTRGTTSSNLTVGISYTDTLGIRRAVEESVPFAFSGSANITGTTLVRTGSSASLSNGILYIIIGVVGIVIIVAFIKLRTRKRK